jgi:hypothetical protein
LPARLARMISHSESRWVSLYLASPAFCPRAAEEKRLRRRNQQALGRVVTEHGVAPPACHSRALFCARTGHGARAQRRPSDRGEDASRRVYVGGLLDTRRDRRRTRRLLRSQRDRLHPPLIAPDLRAGEPGRRSPNGGRCRAFRRPTVRRARPARARLTCLRADAAEWPREGSNLRTRIRSPSLYPLSYGASWPVCPALTHLS